jgi:hypothetical protein
MKTSIDLLRRIIKEEVLREVAKMGVPKRDPFPAPAATEKPSNRRAICMVLKNNGGPMTRQEIVDSLGKSRNPFAKAADSMSAYFINISPFSKAAGGNNMSLLSSGHIKVVGREGASVVYDLTPKGHRLADGLEER